VKKRFVSNELDELIAGLRHGRHSSS
jgi:hypothetical protein